MLGKLVVASLAVKQYEHHQDHKAKQNTMADLEAENLRLKEQQQANQLAQAKQYAGAQQQYQELGHQGVAPIYEPQQQPTGDARQH